MRGDGVWIAERNADGGPARYVLKWDGGVLTRTEAFGKQFVLLRLSIPIKAPPDMNIIITNRT